MDMALVPVPATLAMALVRAAPTALVLALVPAAVTSEEGPTSGPVATRVVEVMEVDQFHRPWEELVQPSETPSRRLALQPWVLPDRCNHRRWVPGHQRDYPPSETLLRRFDHRPWAAPAPYPQEEEGSVRQPVAVM